MKLDIRDGKLDIRDGVKTDIPYVATLPNLKKLKFATGIELKGSLVSTGSVKMSDKIWADFNSTSLGGKINGVLDGDNFNAKLTNISTIALLDMMQYPKIFDTKANCDLHYNIKDEKGKLSADLSGGNFVKNSLMDNIEKYLKFNATKEVFNHAKIESVIEKKLLTSNLDFKSNNTTITSNGAKLNIDKNSIDALLKLAIKDDYVNAKFSGDVNSPKIELDAKDLAIKKATKAIEKNSDKIIDKVVPKNVPSEAVDKAKDLFKKLF